MTTLPNGVSVEGGGAAHAASSIQHVRISGAPTPFGVQEDGYELAPYDEDGTPATAGRRAPFELTSTLVLNQTGDRTRARWRCRGTCASSCRSAWSVIRRRPSSARPADFYAHAPVSEVDECPPGSVVGVAIVTVDEPEVAQ